MTQKVKLAGSCKTVVTETKTVINNKCNYGLNSFELNIDHSLSRNGNYGLTSSIMQDSLFENCKKGDPGAQLHFYKLFYQMAYDVSINLINDANESERIIRESFLVAFEKIGFFSEISCFIAWFKRYVINRTKDRLRNKEILNRNDAKSLLNNEQYCA